MSVGGGRGLAGVKGDDGEGLEVEAAEEESEGMGSDDQGWPGGLRGLGVPRSEEEVS